MDKLPQVKQLIKLEDTDCPHCHQEIDKIGQHLYSREVSLKPAELYYVNLMQESYKCKQCTGDQNSDLIVSSKISQSTSYRIVTLSSTILAKVAEYKLT